MAQKDYYLIYELYEGDPIDIHSSIGPAPLLLDNVLSKIDNIKNIQLMDNDTKKIIAQTRGDAIIIKDTVPASFNALSSLIYSSPGLSVIFSRFILLTSSEPE